MYNSDSLKRTLTPDLIINAYRQGYFPMAEGKHGSIHFFYYEPRGIIPLDKRFIIRRSLRQIINKNIFEVRLDTAFEAVIQACARYDNNSDENIWLSEEMIQIYCELHHQGIAHSVETWQEGILCGGLYGLAIGSAFCGESMFSHSPFASQVALVALVEHLRKKKFTILDAQMESEHLQQFGMYSVSQEEYLFMLQEALMNVRQW